MAQVLRRMTSASSGPEASSYPSAANRPSINSESLTFIWQPYVSTYTRPFVVVGASTVRLEWRSAGRVLPPGGRSVAFLAAVSSRQGPPEDSLPLGLRDGRRAPRPRPRHRPPGAPGTHVTWPRPSTAVPATADER